MSKKREAVKLVLVMVTIIALAFGAFAVIGSALNSQYPLVVVASGSMKPVLYEGDILLIEGVKFEEVKTSPIDGDVIVYRRPYDGRLIVHRAIAREGIGIITKGDANLSPDPIPVTQDMIVGRWTGFKIPHWTGVGYLSLILRGEIYYPLGPLIIVLLVLLNVVYLLSGFSRSPDKSDESQSKGSSGESLKTESPAGSNMRCVDGLSLT